MSTAAGTAPAIAQSTRARCESATNATPIPTHNDTYGPKNQCNSMRS